MENNELRNMDLKRKYEYDIMRIILTVLVIIGHLSLYRFVNDDCGKIGNWFVQVHINEVYQWIYGFHMHSFFFLSGCCFIIEKFESMDELVKNKFHRLIVPYYVGGVLYLAQNIFWDYIQMGKQ